MAKIFGVEMLGYTLATSLFLGLDRNHEHRQIFFGVLCGLFCTVMYAAPLTIMVCTQPLKQSALQFVALESQNYMLRKNYQQVSHRH